MLTRDGFDMIKVLKNYSAKSERRVGEIITYLLLDYTLHQIIYVIYFAYLRRQYQGFLGISSVILDVIYVCVI